jgi:hypothetical protein
MDLAMGHGSALAPDLDEWLELTLELALAHEILDQNMADRMTIKGVGYLGDMMRRETERAQDRINGATQKATSAFGKFHGAVDGVDVVVDAVEREAKEVEKLASELTAQLGNSQPDGSAPSSAGLEPETVNPTPPQS